MYNLPSSQLFLLPTQKKHWTSTVKKKTNKPTDFPPKKNGHPGAS